MMTIRARVTAPATTRGTYTRNETHSLTLGFKARARVGDVDRAGRMPTFERQFRGIDATENARSGVLEAWWSGCQSFRASKGKTRGRAMVLSVMMSAVARARAEGKPRSRARGIIKEGDVCDMGGFLGGKDGV